MDPEEINKIIPSYNTKNDILFVSSEDTEHVNTDTKFNPDLYNVSYKQEATYYDENNDYNDETMETQEPQESEVSLCKWTPPCVYMLIEKFKAKEDIMDSGVSTQKKIWEEIAKDLRASGFNVTGSQCSSKLRSLKKTYRTIKQHNSVPGNDKRSWIHYEIMDEICSKKEWYNQVAVQSVASKQSENCDSARESDSERSTKSSKLTLTSLLAKRLRQKERHEENKMKRHKERMEMDKRLIQAIEKLAKKSHNF